MIQSKWQLSQLLLQSNVLEITEVEVLEVADEEVNGLGDQVEVVGQVRLEVDTGGPASSAIQTCLLYQPVKNIMFSGNPLTGVRSRHLAPGKIFSSLKLNETMTNLISKTYKILCIMITTRK